MKILFIGMTPNPGGLETYMVSIFSQLQNNGFSFDFINTYNQPIAYTNYIKKHNGMIYDVPLKKGLIKYFTRYLMAKHFFKYHHDYDVVHINALSVNEIYWAKAAKKYGIHHVIVQSHNSNIYYKSKIIKFVGNLMALYNRVYLYFHKFVTKLAVSSNSGLWMFGHGADFDVICNGIDTTKFLYNYKDRIKVRQKLGILNNDPLVIVTSKLAKQKNYPKIISIFKEMKLMEPSSKLIIVGDGPEFKYIYKKTKAYNLLKSVYFLGKRDKKDIPKLLHSADLMLMPSLFEGYPYSLIEAQASGVPALVSSKVIPKESNITGRILYLPLSYSDSYWAKTALKILSIPMSINDKYKMNVKVRRSNYNITNSIGQIKEIYMNLVFK